MSRSCSRSSVASEFETAADPETAAQALAAVMRINPIITAALGESSAGYGLVLYFTSGDTQRPWIFFMIALAHGGMGVGSIQ